MVAGRMTQTLDQGTDDAKFPFARGWAGNLWARAKVDGPLLRAYEPIISTRALGQ